MVHHEARLRSEALRAGLALAVAGEHEDTGHRPGSVSHAAERVSEGTRTPDRLDHNQELYQLSYAHHGDLRVT